MWIARSVTLMGCLLASMAGPTCADAQQPKPVKVFILAGQSNMEGQAVVDLDGKNYNDGKGTLKALMNDPKKAPLFTHLKNDKGEWTVREDVWVSRIRMTQAPEASGNQCAMRCWNFTKCCGR